VQVSGRVEVERQKRLDLAARVRPARAKAGLSQQELADQAGVSRGTIKNIEAGAKVPQEDKLNRVLDVLGLLRKHSDSWTDEQWWIAESTVALFDQLPVARHPEAAAEIAKLFGQLLREPKGQE